MAQVTIYLPDEVEQLVRKEAQRKKKSLSAFMADLATAHVRFPDRRKRLEALFGSWEGDFPESEPGLPLDEPSL